MLNVTYLEHADLLKSPCRQLFRKLPVDCLFRLSVDTLDTGPEPLVL